MDKHAYIQMIQAWIYQGGEIDAKDARKRLQGFALDMLMNIPQQDINSFIDVSFNYKFPKTVLVGDPSSIRQIRNDMGFLRDQFDLFASIWIIAIHSNFQTLLDACLSSSESESVPSKQNKNRSSGVAKPLHTLQGDLPTSFDYKGNLSGWCFACEKDTTFCALSTTESWAQTSNEIQQKSSFFAALLDELSNVLDGGTLSLPYKCETCSGAFDICRVCYCPNRYLSDRKKCDHCDAKLVT